MFSTFRWGYGCPASIDPTRQQSCSPSEDPICVSRLKDFLVGEIGATGEYYLLKMAATIHFCLEKDGYVSTRVFKAMFDNMISTLEDLTNRGRDTFCDQRADKREALGMLFQNCFRAIEKECKTGIGKLPIPFSGICRRLNLPFDSHIPLYDYRFINSRSYENYDLRMRSLCDVDFFKANLARADLRAADLQDSNLGGADLQGADLRGAHFQNTDLYYANLRKADFRGTDLRGAKIRACSTLLEGVLFEDAVFNSDQLNQIPKFWSEGADFGKDKKKFLLQSISETQGYHNYHTVWIESAIPEDADDIDPNDLFKPLLDCIKSLEGEDKIFAFNMLCENLLGTGVMTKSDDILSLFRTMIEDINKEISLEDISFPAIKEFHFRLTSSYLGDINID